MIDIKGKFNCFCIFHIPLSLMIRFAYSIAQWRKAWPLIIIVASSVYAMYTKNTSTTTLYIWNSSSKQGLIWYIMMHSLLSALWNLHLAARGHWANTNNIRCPSNSHPDKFIRNYRQSAHWRTYSKVQPLSKYNIDCWLGLN